MNLADNMFFLIALYWAGFGVSVGVLGMLVWFVWYSIQRILGRK